MNTHRPARFHTYSMSCDHAVCVVVVKELQSEGAFRDTDVVIAGLSNVYTHYITTFEEYQVHAAGGGGGRRSLSGI